MKEYRIFGLTFFFIGLIMIISDSNITGSAIGIVSTKNNLVSLSGFILIIFSLILFAIKQDLERIILEHSWSKFAINRESILTDIEQEYLSNIAPKTRTDLQERIERAVSGKLIEDAQNKRRTYDEQFYEGHASQGGRVIDVESHLVRDKEDIDKLVYKRNKGLKYYEGRIIHFGEPANGQYIWVVDEDGNFIIANRQTFLHRMDEMNKELSDRFRRIHKLPHPTLARGKEVLGSGEVLIQGGLIKSYNTISGHYLNLKDIKKFNEQGKEVFKYFTHKFGWKEIDGGAEYKIRD